MKIRAKVTGVVIDLSEEGAKQLIDAGIYEAVEPAEKPTRTKRAP